MALDITSQEFLQQQLLSRDPIRDRGWSEALNIIDTWDRDAADACEAVLKIYEAEHDSQSARTWEKLVISMARDPHNFAVLYEQAKRALTNLSVAAVPQETRAQRAAKLVEEARAKAAAQAAKAAQATQAAQAAKAAQAAQAAKATQVAQAAQTAQANAYAVQTVQVAPVAKATKAAKLMEVREEEGEGTPRKWDITRAPLSYSEIRRLGPFLRSLTGVVMIGYSIVSAAFVIGWLLMPVITFALGPVPGSYLIGAILGSAVTLGQWNTREKLPVIHWCLVLFLDAPFSGYTTYSWVSIVAMVHFVPEGSSMPQDVWLTCIGIALAWGVASAKFGEALLIGRKRKH